MSGVRRLSTVIVSVVLAAASAGIVTVVDAAAANAESSPYQAAVRADSPRLYFPFNEPSGAVTDASGHVRPARVSAAARTTLGVDGNAVAFDGSRSRVEVSYSRTMQLPASFSIEVWAKLPSTSNRSTPWPTIFSRGNVNAGHYGEAMWFSPSGGHQVSFKRDGVSVSTHAGLTSQRFRQIVFTWNNGAKRWAFYVDGALDNTGTTKKFSGTDRETLALEIGAMRASSKGAAVNYGNVTVDELSFYGTTLNAGRVAAHYTAATRTRRPVTGSPRVSPSPSADSTPTQSPSLSPTPSPSLSADPSLSASPDPSPSATPSTSPSTTPTPTPTPTPTVANGYLAGVAVGGIQPWNPNRAADYAAMGAAHASWIRSDLAWEYLEPTPGNWQFGLYDPVVADAQNNGMRYLAILHTVPSWANGGVGDYGLPSDPATLTNYCYQVVKHFLPRGVTEYEIGNEINLPHPGWNPDGATYATRYLIPCVTGLRQAQAEVGGNATVLFGSMAPTDWTGGVDPATFLTDAYTAGAHGWFDAIGWHPYSGADSPTIARQFVPDPTALAAVMARNGDAGEKIWGTEYGQATGGPNSVTEQVQSDLVPVALATWYAQPWAGPLFWYSGRDTGTATNDREQHFGLLRYDGSPKPAYATLRSLVVRGS